MSTTLCWIPPPSEVKEHYVGLKYEIGRYFDEYYNGESADFGLIGPEIIPFLKGIAAVGNKEAIDDVTRLIAAIKKYGKIQLYIR